MKPCLSLLVLSSALFLAKSPLFCETGSCAQTKQATTLVRQVQYLDLDVNQIRCTISSDGAYADCRKTSTMGLEWPKGSGKSPLFAGGFWLIGKHRPTNSLRTAVAYYTTEFQPGPLLEIFNTSTNDDTGPVSRSTDSLYRLYKIDRGDTLGKDYLEWPGNLGAPYDDRNGNGIWDPGIDKPRFYGDQQVWSVFNDAVKTRHSSAGMTSPMGLEFRALYWAFNHPGPLGNTMFMKWQIINRSDADYDSVYLAIWDDVDLGDANDDLPGCDTTLNLGYAYNERENDAKYGSPPPAVGFTYLQGPVVHGIAGDMARFGEGWRVGFRNLGMTSYVPTSCAVFLLLTCPSLGSPTFAPTAYNFLRGMLAPPGGYLTRPDSSIIRFFFSGDPVAGTGDLPVNFPLGVWGGQETYIGTNTGPFSLAQGDTQEVVVAIVVSQGTDRLNSVTALKQDVATVKALYGFGPTVGVGWTNHPFPDRCELLQNYPNPFNPVTSIRYSVGELGSRQQAVGNRVVRLVVYDLLGREVAVLVDEKKQPGQYTATWDATGMPSGVYFYRLMAGGACETKKMLLLR